MQTLTTFSDNKELINSKIRTFQTEMRTLGLSVLVCGASMDKVMPPEGDTPEHELLAAGDLSELSDSCARASLRAVFGLLSEFVECNAQTSKALRFAMESICDEGVMVGDTNEGVDSDDN